MRAVVISVLAALLVLAGAVGSVADPQGSGGPPAATLKAWTADVSPEVLGEIRAAGFTITSEEVIDGDTVRIEVIASAKDIAAFRGDAQFRLTRGQLRVDRTADLQGLDGVFRPYDGPDGLEAEMVALAQANPDLVKLVDIGDTLQGRDIWAIKVTKNANLRPDGTKPAVLYNAAQHAREWITPEMVRRLNRYFLDSYGSDQEITQLVDENELWFVWVANPDGYQWTHEDAANRLWRKNLRDNDGDGVITNVDGVDLNRNFAYKWGYDNEGSSPQFTSEVYRGAGPMSEPETQAMDAFVGSMDFAFMLNYHSAAELILYGVGWQVDTPSPDDLVQIALAGDDANPAVPGYDPDQSAELYITNGATTGHVHNLHGTLAFTPEMSTCQTISDRYADDEWEAEDCQSGFNFPDDEDLVQEEFEDNLPFALDIARSAADPSNPVSHLGNVAPEIVVDEFTQSNGTEQVVQIRADRELGAVRMYFSINGGKTTKVNTTEWDGGERYGAENDLYYAWRRGTVTGQQPGDEVEVWFEAKGTSTDPFSYTVTGEIGGDVLVVADNSPGSGLGGEEPGDAYLAYYTDAIEANGHTWDFYQVSDDGPAPHPLGVLGHYDAVVWFTGDKLVTDYQGGLNTTLLAHEMNIVMRDYLNEGGKILATGKNHGFEEFFPLDYGENADPTQVCESGDCRELSNDVYQYWFGGYNRTRRGGLDLDSNNALGIQGVDEPYAGYDWTLDGGDSANNQGASDGTNDTGTGTAAWTLTSDVLSVEEFPQFESWASADWISEGGPFEPLTGDYYMASLSDNAAWKRLATTVDLTEASSGSVEINLSYDIESPYWDFLIFEVHTVGQDDWTTLEVPGLTSQGLGTTAGVDSSCLSGWQEQLHPQIERYQTLNDDGTCSPTGTTGEWNAVAGSGNGWETWDLDLSAYAGSEVELVISYVTDWGTLGQGVFVDDTSVIVDGVTVRETSFETDLGGWEVLGPPEGTAPSAGDWTRSTAVIITWAAVTTPDTVLHGFGFEGITSQAQRNEVMRRTLEHLLP
jgi:hypothetical protein